MQVGSLLKLMLNPTNHLEVICLVPVTIPTPTSKDDFTDTILVLTGLFGLKHRCWHAFNLTQKQVAQLYSKTSAKMPRDARIRDSDQVSCNPWYTMRMNESGWISSFVCRSRTVLDVK